MRRSDSIFRGTIFILIARIIDLGAAIAGFILVARFLGVAGIGRYSFIIAYVSVFGLVVNLGIDNIVIREIARNFQLLPRILGATIKLKLYLLAVITPLILGGLLLFRLDVELKYSILLLFTAQILLREMFTVVSQAVFLSCEKLEYRTITTLVFQVLRIGGIVTVLTTGHGLVPLFAAVIFADLVQGVWTVNIVNRRFSKPDFSASRAEVWYFFKQAIPIAVAFGFTTAFFHLDNFLLKGIKGDYENGLFSSAYRVILTPIQIIVPIIWVILPHLTRTFHQSRETLRREGEFYLKCIAAAMIPAALTIGFYSTPVMRFAFGEEYVLSGIALAIVAPTLAFRGVLYMLDLSLIAAERQNMVAVSAGSAFLTKLILGILLIPRLGYLGAAWGTLGAELIAFTVASMLVRHWVVKYNLWRALSIPVFAAAITLLPLYGLKDNPLVGIPVGMVVCLALVFILGTFNREERENIVSLLRRKLGRNQARLN